MSLQGVDEIALKIKITPEGDWVVENLQERVKKSTRSISEDFSRADKSLAAWMKNIAAAALLFVGFQSAASEIKGMVRDTIAFDTELTQVTTLIDTSSVNVGKMTEGLFEMAGAMGTVGELTRGVYQEISASVAPEKALNELTEAAKAAAGGQAALSDTVNLGTTVWNVYGAAAQNMTHIYDVMWQVVKDGKSNMAQLSAYMGEFIPLAKEAGLTFEQASGALAIMSQISGKVNISVTQLKAIMQAVIKPTQEAADEAERIGINFTTAAIKTQGFEAWLKNLLVAVKQNNGDMSKLFGSVEGLSGILQLTRNNLKNYTDEMVRFGQVHGNNEENFKKYKESLKGSWEEIKNRVQAVLIQVILPLMKEVAKWVRENSDNIMSFVKNFISGFKTVIGFIVQFKDAIIFAGKAWLIHFAIEKIAAWKTAFQAGMGGAGNILSTFVKMKDVFVELKADGASTFQVINGSLDQVAAKSKLAAAALGMIQTVLVTLAVSQLIEMWNILNEIVKVEDYIRNQQVRNYQEDVARWKEQEAAMVEYLKMATDDWQTYADFVVNMTQAERKAVGETFQEKLNYMRRHKEEFKDVIPWIEKGLAMWQIEKGMHTQLTKQYDDEIKKMFQMKGIPLPEYFNSIGKEIVKVTGATEEQEKAFEDLAKSMSIVTQKGLLEQTKEIKSLLGLYSDYKAQIIGNEETLKKWVDRIDELYKTALPGEKEALEKVREEMILAYGEQNKVIVSTGDYTAQVMESVSMLFPWTQAIYENRDALYAQRLMISAIATGNMPMLMAAWEKMGLKMTGTGAATADTRTETEKLADSFTALTQAGNMAIDALQQMGVISGDLAGIFKGVTGGVNAFGAGLDAWGKAASMANQPGKGFESILGKISAGIGMFSGAVSVGVSIFTGFVSLLKGKSGELKAAERILRGLGDAAEGFAEKIEKLAKELGGKGSAERAFGEYMSEIFGNMAASVNSFDIMFQKMMDYGAAVQWAGISLDEAAKNYGKAFSEVLRIAQETGQVGGDKFLYIIENADKLGLKCKEITEYVETKTQSAFEGWQKATKAFGDINIPIFKNMQRELDIIASIPPEIMEGIEGLTQSVIDYSSAHRLLPEEFAAFNTAASTAINQLKNQDKTNEEIAIAMAPLIQKLAFLQKEFGFSVDATTQEIIDQAKKMGLLEGDYRNSNQIMKDGFGEVTLAIRELSRAIRGDFTESFTTAAVQVRTSTGIMVSNISTVQGSVRATADEIKKMGTAIKGVDSDFVLSITGNTIMVEINKMQGGIRGTIVLTQDLGQAILPVHGKWINSSAAMQAKIKGIQERVTELQDLIEGYKGKLTELEAQEKAQNEAELEMLEGLLATREAALGVSEELSSIQFDADSFAHGVWSIYEVFTALEKGIITTNEAANELGDSFNVMIGKAKSLGMEGSASLLQFMRDVKASGLDVPEIKAYKTDQLSGGNKALSDYLSTFADTAAIRANIADLENELRRARGARRTELQLEITEQKGLLDQGIQDIKNNAQSMGIYTLGMFTSMIENGATYMEAMKEMGPQLSQLKNLYKEAGIEVSGPLKEMLDMQKFIEQQGQLADRISASTKMLQALGNTGNLTREIFNQFQTDAAAQFDELVGKTGDRKKTLQLLAPELAKMLWYSEQNEGLTLDPKIQEMIAEATRQGIDLKAMLPAQEQMVGHLQELVSIEKDILDALTNPTPPPYLAYPTDNQKTPPLSAAAGIRFIVPPGYEDIRTGFPMLVHTGELVQVFPPEETSRIMDYFKYQPIFELPPKEKGAPGDSPSGITIYNIFRDEEEEEFTETMKTPGGITGNQSQGNETIEINIPIEKIQVTFEPKTGATLPKDDDLEEFSRKFKKVIVDDVRQAASVAAAEFKRRMR